MDQLTHNVRRANWLNIIKQCQERPANVTVRQWLKDNDIKEKSYYYWLSFAKNHTTRCNFQQLLKNLRKFLLLNSQLPHWRKLFQHKIR